MKKNQQYTLKIVSINDYIGLSNDWLSLEERSNNTFFLSWTWINTWLESYFPCADVLSVHYEGELIALSLLCKSTFSSWKRASSRRLHINQTGDPNLDQVWIEYNGLLCTSVHEHKVQNLLMTFLIEHYPGWDELQVGAVTRGFAKALQESSKLSCIELWNSPSYGVDLESLRNENLGFFDSLSRNTRYQIRRSMKLYSGMGDLRLEFASSEEDALKFFDEIAPFHLKKWGDKLGESGFSNPAFIQFHQNLIKAAFPLNQIDLIKIVCGDRVLGYLYNFIYRGRVYFYLSGFVSEQDSKLKPGLSAHALAIQHYFESGCHFYDFMGGQDRYKLSLGKAHEELCHISLQKPYLKFKVEAFLRGLKQHFAS